MDYVEKLLGCLNTGQGLEGFEPQLVSHFGVISEFLEIYGNV